MSVSQFLARRKIFVRGPSKLLTREYIAFYLFASPWLLGLLFFVLGPTIASFGLSFTDYPVIVAPKFVGLQNFIDMANDDLVAQALKVTSLYSLGAVPLGLTASFLVALLLPAVGDFGRTGCPGLDVGAQP
jgi:multiple sugar transport system permease protein